MTNYLRLLFPLLLLGVLCFLLYQNITINKNENVILLEKENVMGMLHEAYRTGYIQGSNNAVDAVNTGTPIDRDYVTTNLFHDSTLFFRQIVITESK